MKNKWLLSLLGTLLLASVSTAKVVPVPQSGINWKKSTLSVLRFQPSDQSHRDSFNCFGTNYQSLPFEMSLEAMGFGSPDSGPLTLNQVLDSQACFQQSGSYEVLANVFDYAGNERSFRFDSD